MLKQIKRNLTCGLLASIYLALAGCSSPKNEGDFHQIYPSHIESKVAQKDISPSIKGEDYSFKGKTEKNELEVSSILKFETKYEEFVKGKKKGIETTISSLKIPTHFSFEKQLDVFVEPAFRFTDQPYTKLNESYQEGEATGTIDQLALSYKSDNFGFTIGKFTDPFKLDIFSWDKRIKPEGITFDVGSEIGLLDKVNLRGAFYDGLDWNNNPSAKQAKLELLLIDKIGPFNIEGGIAYTDVYSASNPRKLLPTGDEKGSFIETGGTLSINLKNFTLNKISLLGNYTISAEEDNSSHLFGIRAELLDGRLKPGIFYFDNNEGVYPSAVSYSDIGSRSTRGIYASLDADITKLFNLKLPFNIYAGGDFIMGTNKKTDVETGKYSLNLRIEYQIK